MKVSIIVPRELKKRSIYSIFRNAPIGATYIGTSLDKTGHQVEILDEFLTRVDPKTINSEVVGISVLTVTAPRGYKIAKDIKQYSPKTRVVMGGPHVTFLSEEALNHGADFVVRGEGEETIVELVDVLENGGSLERILGISYKEKGRIIHNPDRPAIQNLDDLPFPDYSLVKDLPKNPSVTFMNTSRGCPYGCKFCAVIKMHGRHYRFRSPESVVEELEQRMPVKQRLFFTDDNFIANPERAKRILNLMKEKNLLPNMWWGTQVRVDVAKDEELLELMRETKVGMLYIGLESINPKTLEEYNKKQSVADVKKCVRKLHDYGIEIFGMLVIGSDHDTKESIRATADFCIDADIDVAQLTAYTPLPGTELYKELDKERRILTKDWENYDLEHVVHEPKLISAYELQVELDNAFRRIYSGKRALKKFFSKDPYSGLVTAYLGLLSRKRIRQQTEYLVWLKSLA